MADSYSRTDSKGVTVTVHSNGNITRTDASGNTTNVGKVSGSQAQSFIGSQGGGSGGGSGSGTSGGGGGGGGGGSTTTSTPTPSGTKTNYNLTNQGDRNTDWNSVAQGHSPDIAYTTGNNSSTGGSNVGNTGGKDWGTITDATGSYPSGGGGGGGSGFNGNENGEQKDYPYPQYQQKDYPDYSGQFASIQNYISGLSGDLSGMRDLMEKNNSMFLSKLDAQMTQQKAMEEKFNAEWAKVEGQLDENTREQKSRLDKMEQTYNANLQKMQDMLEEYYTGTMTALEAKKAGESAAAASDLSAKGLNSAVVANTQAGLDKNYREQFNSLMKANIELGQQLNNDYADFMKNLVDQHQTIDQYQTNTLIDGVKMKQQYIDQQGEIMQDYVNSVYKPLENYYTKISDTYTEQAVDSYSRELSNQAYQNASFADRVSTLYNKLIATLGDYGDVTALSQYDWDLINELANNKNLSKDQAMIELLKRVGSSGKGQDSAIYDALSNYNGTRNPNPSPTKTNNEQNYSDDSDTRLANITDNLSKYAKSNPELFADRNKFNAFFKYDQRSDKQKAVLDEYFNAFNKNKGNNNTSTGQPKLIYSNNGISTLKNVLNNIKDYGDTPAGQIRQLQNMMTVMEQDKDAIKKYMATLDRGSDEYIKYNKLLTEYENFRNNEMEQYFQEQRKQDKLWYLQEGTTENVNSKIKTITNNANLSNTAKKNQLTQLRKQVESLAKTYPAYQRILQNIDKELSYY